MSQKNRESPRRNGDVGRAFFNNVSDEGSIG